MKFEVWYMRPDWFREGIFGVEPDPNDLGKTHIHLKDLQVGPDDLDGQLEWVFRHMQGEVWSPNGEARPLIAGKGLTHTSMSVGDVIRTGGKTYVVKGTGFMELN